MPKANKKRRVDEEITISHSSPAPKKKKKKRVEEDTKPKKKKRSTDLVPVGLPPSAGKRLEKRKRKLNAALEELDIEKLTKHARPGEREYLDEYVWMFNRIGRLIRTTEKRALKSGQSRDVYALSTLISQQREIIADIRTLADLSGQIIMVKERVLQPMVNHLAQNILDVFYQMRRLLMETTKPNETQFALQRMEEMMKEQGKFLQLQYNEGSQNLDSIMSGTEPVITEKAKPKKKKKKG